MPTSTVPKSFNGKIDNLDIFIIELKYDIIYMVPVLSCLCMYSKKNEHLYYYVDLYYSVVYLTTRS